MFTFGRGRFESPFIRLKLQYYIIWILKTRFFYEFDFCDIKKYGAFLNKFVIIGYWPKIKPSEF